MDKKQNKKNTGEGQLLDFFSPLTTSGFTSAQIALISQNILQKRPDKGYCASTPVANFW